MNLVKHILDDARKRLAVLDCGAPVCDAAAILTDANTPLVVVYARDLARALLDEVTHEELLLRDYVMGIGYQ